MNHATNSYEIEITQRHGGPRIGEDLLRRTVVCTLAAEQVRDAEISVALTDDEEIHRINREFLEHDYPTDVISFTLPQDGFDVKTAQGRLEGELVVSVETAVREAAAAGWSLESEVVLYVVHGLLHLCGYDDQDEASRRRMRLREREILSLLNVSVVDPDEGAIGQGHELGRRRLV